MGTKVMVHGESVVSSETRSSLKSFRAQLGKTFRHQDEGDRERRRREARVLIVRVSEEGWDYEEDQRHGERTGKSPQLGNRDLGWHAK